MSRRAQLRAAALAALVIIGLGSSAIAGCSGSGDSRPAASSPSRSGGDRSTARRTGAEGSGASGALPPGAQAVTIGERPESRAVPSGFVGVSLEQNGISRYVWGDPALLGRLIQNLAPGQAPVLRIGGDSTDWAWWPTAGLARPPGIHIPLSPHWLAEIREVADAARAGVIMGVNLEADSRALAASEAIAFKRGLGKRLDALELGNEPDLYQTFPWYTTAAGRRVPGRSSGYGFGAFTRDFVRIAAALPEAPLAGPAIGTPPWTRYLGNLLAAEPRISLLTLHRYPLQRCYTGPSSPRYPTIQNLLAPRSSRGLADALIPAVTAGHRRGVPVRLDEINSVACGGSRGVSNTFASALWALEVSLELARVGLDGVNFHTFPGAAYQLFSFRGAGTARTAHLYPEYYGLMMFAQAAPPGSRLLRAPGPSPGRVGVWATRDSGGTIRVVLVNDSATHARTVALRVPEASGPGALELMTAPSLKATDGVTLAGRSFGAGTHTGVLSGAPRTARVDLRGGRFVVPLGPASAALLTLPPPGAGASVGNAAALAPRGELQQHG